jgi:hypothetical protein
MHADVDADVGASVEAMPIKSMKVQAKAKATSKSKATAKRVVKAKGVAKAKVAMARPAASTVRDLPN